MKKVFAVGVATMLMMGAASQAMAAFDYGTLIMTVYDRDALVEKSFDLGNIDDLLSNAGTTTQTIDIGDNGWIFNASKSGVGIFANQFNSETYASKGYYALKTDDPTKTVISSDASGFDTASEGIITKMQNDADHTISTNDANSFTRLMNLKGNSPGAYASVVTKSGFEAEYPTVAGSVTTMYLYGFDTNEYSEMIAINGGNHVATITLNNAGLVTFSANSAPVVPVPGAALLFGSALLGLAGIRRRQNS